MFAVRAPHAFDGTRFLAGGATVLVEGGRIVGVEAADFPVPEGCEVSSYDGTLMPGLVDAHVHLVADAARLARAGGLDDAEEVDAEIEKSLATQAAHGVTTVLDLGDRRLPDAGVPRPRDAGPAAHPSPPDRRSRSLGATATSSVAPRPAPDDLVAAVAAHHERGVDVIKVMASGGFLTPGTDMLGAQYAVADLRVLVGAAHDVGLEVLAHAHSINGMEVPWPQVSTGSSTSRGSPRRAA